MKPHSFKIGDRVRLVRLDGTLSEEVVTIHDLWGDADSPRNASFLSGNCEQYWHTDLMKAEGDTSPVDVPEQETWFIARGNNQGWGRARTLKGAVANMRRQGGKVTSYVVHRVCQWTAVDGMGCLTYPSGSDPVETFILRDEKKKSA